MTDRTQTTQAQAIAEAIAQAEDEARRIAKRDGVPAAWIEAVLAKIRGEKAGTA